MTSLLSKDDAGLLSRARGCMMGQLSGDALGSLVEFKSPEEIRRLHPVGVRRLVDGGTWNTLAGQPTDDSEMALLLARSLIKHRTHNPEQVLLTYRYWVSTQPFDMGMTISEALAGSLNHASQANGALMRISPVGILGAGRSLDQVAAWAASDARLTHPNLICQQANQIFAMALAYAITTGCSAKELYQRVLQWAEGMQVEAALAACVLRAADEAPADFIHQMGWVLIALQNALHQLLHAANAEEAICKTVMMGGDTDTNAAICGALLGAVHGLQSLPAQWVEAILACRPSRTQRKCHHPRPKCLWPMDALELADQLLEIGFTSDR